MLEIINTIIPCLFLLLGLYLGYNIGKNNQLPEIKEIKTPGEIIEDKKIKKKIAKDKKRQLAYLENINNYPYDQKDIEE